MLINVSSMKKNVSVVPDTRSRASTRHPRRGRVPDTHTPVPDTRTRISVRHPRRGWVPDTHTPVPDTHVGVGCQTHTHRCQTPAPGSGARHQQPRQCQTPTSGSGARHAHASARHQRENPAPEPDTHFGGGCHPRTPVTDTTTRTHPQTPASGSGARHSHRCQTPERDTRTGARHQ
jgi:hypothetical protein